MLAQSPEDTRLCGTQELEDGPIYLPLSTDGSEAAEAPRLCPDSRNFIPQADACTETWSKYELEGKAVVINENYQPEVGGPGL